MASFEFDCPHCSGRFEVENPPAGGEVACPHCQRKLAIPSTLPATHDSAAPLVPLGGEAPAMGGALDFVEPVPQAARSRGGRGQSPPLRAAPAHAPLSREEKERRRQLQTLIWLVGGVVLLAIAAMVLSQL